jgi:hypothetical protein
MIKKLCKFPSATEVREYYKHDCLNKNEPWEPFKSHKEPKIIDINNLFAWENWGSYRTKLKLISSIIKEKLEHYSTDELVLLDIGCGLGYYMNELSNNLKHIIGIDSCTWSIRYAEKLNIANNNVRVYESLHHAKESGELKFPYEKPDFILALDFLEHLRYPDKFLYNISEHLNGYLILSTPINEEPTISYNPITIKETYGHIWSWSKEDLFNMLEAADLEVDLYLEYESTRFKPFNEMIIFAKRKDRFVPGFVREQVDLYA